LVNLAGVHNQFSTKTVLGASRSGEGNWKTFTGRLWRQASKAEAVVSCEFMKGTMLRTVKRLAAILLLLAGGASAQTVKRLILTDGSYQAATEWKQTSDRVKYFSAERGEWEEIPAALVDWKATGEWNAERAKSATEEMKQVTEEEVAARKEAESNTPMVAPELRLPSEGGVFLLEELAGKPVLNKVESSKIQVNDNVGKNMLKKSIIPIASQMQTVELKGPAAKVRLHSAAPAIFVDVENDRGAIPGENFRIVRLERKRDLRVLAKNKVGMTGEASVTERFLQARVEKFSGDWWKIIPLEDLTAGEYAIVISTPGDDGYGAVWDFGVEGK
jgi:hypothetical protein